MNKRRHCILLRLKYANIENGMSESLQDCGFLFIMQNLEKAQRRVRASAAASVPGLVRGSDGPEPIKPGSIEDLE